MIFRVKIQSARIRCAGNNRYFSFSTLRIIHKSAFILKISGIKRKYLGLHYFHGKQSGSATGVSNGKANFVVAVADYAFSKRTDAYVGIDNTRLSGGDNVYLDAASKARSRTGFTIGLRHRF